MANDTDWISKLNDLSQVNDLESAFTRLLLLPIAAVFVQLSNAVEAVSNVIILPVRQFGESLIDVVDAIIGGPADIVEAGVAASVGDVNVFGIGGFPVALMVVFLGAFIISWYLGRDESSNFIPFSFTDLPFVGVDEDAEE